MVLASRAAMLPGFGPPSKTGTSLKVRPAPSYTHGSQVTAAHGHVAFFGAYVLLNRMFFYYAMPELRGIARFQERRGHVTFW
jgi:nitric oxide reductase large subunit